MTTCASCGRRINEGSQWCPYCGAQQMQASPAYQPPQGGQQPPQGGYQPPQTGYQPPQGGYQPPQTGYQAPPPGYSPPPAGGGGGIQGIVQDRMRTDEVLQPAMYFALIIVGWIVAIALSVTVNGLAFWIYNVILAFVIYKMINRMNLHSAREAALRNAIIQYFREKASSDPSVAQKISAPIATMESIQYDAMNQEREQNAILWAVLSVIIPFIFLYPLYFLTKFSSGHDRRWHAFTQQAQYAGQQIGMSIVLPSWRTLPERSFFLYLVLTVVTFGLFGIYWFYVLLKDLNEHFPVQWQFEDQFIREMR